MASQHLVAFSESCTGAGLAAGSPYGCPIIPQPVQSCQWYNRKTWHEAGDLQGLWKYTEGKGSKIDALTNLKDVRLYIFQGSDDYDEDERISKKTQQYFAHYTPQSSIKTNFNIPAGHAWVVSNRNYGGKCGGESMLQDCNFDLAGEVLSWLGVSQAKVKAKASSKHIYTVDQRKYVPAGHTARGISLSAKGYVYVPAVCRATPSACAIHIFYHGCEQSVSYVGMEVVEGSGLNEHAEASGIIILYPQADDNRLLDSTACFDWSGRWGAGSHFDEKSGLQLATVANMLHDIGNIAQTSARHLSTPNATVTAAITAP